MPFLGYQDLSIWKKAMDLTDEVYRLIKKLPREEFYALGDQLRRSAISIPSNIAEGRGRQSDADFRHFLYIARGSCCELETQIFIGIRQGYFQKEEAEKILVLSEEVGRMLTSLIRTLGE